MDLVAGLSLSDDTVTLQVHELGTGRVHDSTIVLRAGASDAPVGIDAASWVAAVAGAIDAVPARTLRCIAISGPLHGLVVLDAQHHVVRPVLAASDQCSVPDAGWCRKKLAPDWWEREIGIVPTAAHTVTKLSWLHRTEPDVWGLIAHFLAPHDFVSAALANVMDNLCTDESTASGTGYWSVRQHRYHPDVLGLIDAERHWTQLLPSVLDSPRVLGEYNGVDVALSTSHPGALCAALDLVPGDVLIMLEGPARVIAVTDVACDPARNTGSGSADTTDMSTDADPVERLPDTRGVGLVAVQLEDHGLDTVTPDTVRRALEVLGVLGVQTHGRMIVSSDRSDLSLVAPWLAKSLGRRVLRCGFADATAQGAAQRAAHAVTGSWPQWRTPSSLR